MVLGLKIDVCTFDGLRIGVPNLLQLLDQRGVQATFFVALGPDTTGRAVLRILQPGFLAKMRRTRAIRTYGLRTIVSGTLLPPRHAGRLPRGFGAPGWQVSVTSLRALDEMGFAYASDTRGTQPFFPRVAGRALRTLQLPTTCPTLDEILGLGGLDGDGYVALVRRELQGKTRGILTLHAEMEGIGFRAVADRLIAALHAEGAQWLPLEILAEQVRAEGEDRVPVVEVVPRPIRGRAGTVAMPAGLEVPFEPLTTG